MRLTWLERWIHTGSVHLHFPDGETVTIGEGAPEASIHVHRKAALARMAANPDVAVGETYMDGDWEPGEGGLLALFELYFRNAASQEEGGSRVGRWLQRGLRFLVEANGLMRSRRNVQHHYDMDAELFRHFLDEDLQYSCAYFHSPDMSLEAAQRAKREHIARKLCLRPGDRVLDIGSGWGGTALYLAREWGAEVTGLTLSDDQHGESERRAAAEGLEDRVRFRLEDYREHAGSYDAIVSVGMFEHVGRPQFPVFFDTVQKLLKPGGRALLHTIGRSGPPVENVDNWITRHIFPGGYIPSLSEAALPMERSGLVLSDLEVWRRHYAYTLEAWNERFQAAREQFRERLGERFCRMWEFYLLGCQATFTWGDLVVFQFQMAHENDTVPLARDYLYPAPEPVSVREAG